MQEQPRWRKKKLTAKIDSKGWFMPSPEYYRRQSELCFRMAMLQDNTSTTYWLVELAKDLQAKADAAASDRDGALLPTYLLDKA